jgi:glycosyltransferase involved in cell wall biosynthesis
MLSKDWFQKHSRHLGFFPDISSSNSYQNMLYSESRKANWIVKAIETPFDVPPDVDAVHIHWQNTIWRLSHLERSELMNSDFTSLFAFKNHVSRKKRHMIWTVHNLVPHDSTELDSEIALMRKMNEESDVIHFLTHESVAEIKKFIPVDERKIIVEPLCSYSGFLPNKLNSEAMRQRYGIAKESLIIGFVGQIRPYKNVQQLIDAFLELYEEFHNLVLIVAGLNQDPIVDRSMRELSQQFDYIHYIDRFLTPIEFAELSSLIQIACYPYTSILNSGSLFSSLTFGHHIVVPNHPGLSSFKNERFVTFFDANSLVSLRTSLKEVIKNNLYFSTTSLALRFAQSNNASKMSRNFFEKLNRKLEDSQ